MGVNDYGGWSGITGGALILAVPGGILTEYLHHRLTGKVTGIDGTYYTNNYWDWPIFFAGAAGTWVLVVGAILLFGIRR